MKLAASVQAASIKRRTCNYGGGGGGGEEKGVGGGKG